MAAAPKALLLLGVLAAALLLSSHVTSATEGQQTVETAAEAAAGAHTIIEDKQVQADAVCSNCCRWVQQGFWLRCARCCGAGEEAPVQVADAIVDNKMACRCCLYIRYRGTLRCVRYCCADGKEVGVEPKEKPQN